jgi:membrane protease subunit (stomatin/prohibitin family)
MGAIGLSNMNTYLQYQAAQAMREAAQNQGAAGAGAAEGLGIGAGLGMGAAMAGMINQAMRPSEAPAQPAAAAPATMACPNCRSQIPVNAKFCPECGTKLGGPARCPQCNADVAPGAKFCAECGARLAS